MYGPNVNKKMGKLLDEDQRATYPTCQNWPNVYDISTSCIASGVLVSGKILGNDLLRNSIPP